MKIEQLKMTFPGEGDWSLLVAFAASPKMLIIGSVAFCRHGPVADFCRLFVKEGFRRQGVGRALINHIEQVARTAGCTAISCYVHPKNIDAKLFYSRLGFITGHVFPDGDLLQTKAIRPLEVVQSGTEPIRTVPVLEVAR